MKETKKSVKNTMIVLSFLMLGIFILYSQNSLSLPAEPSLINLSTTTSAGAGIGKLRAGDDGGTITTLALNALQQNLKWKAYIGNVTGRYVLEDADGMSIYEWDMSLNTEGKVFIARNGTVDWTTINCSSRPDIDSEDTFMTMGTGSDNINNTFSESKHKTFKVAGITIPTDDCPSIATYVNDTAQVASSTALFQEVILADGAGNIVYTSIMEQDKTGYDNSSTFDFQAIVADVEGTGTKTPYYFYVELGI